MFKKRLILPIALISALIFGGCASFVAKPADITTESPDVTLTGSLVQTGTKFVLSQPGQPPIELDSRQITLANYVGQSVTVTGQYSGTTLFVSKIQ